MYLQRGLLFYNSGMSNNDNNRWQLGLWKSKVKLGGDKIRESKY